MKEEKNLAKQAMKTSQHATVLYGISNSSYLRVLVLLEFFPWFLSMLKCDVEA